MLYHQDLKTSCKHFVFCHTLVILYTSCQRAPFSTCSGHIVLYSAKAYLGGDWHLAVCVADKSRVVLCRVCPLPAAAMAVTAAGTVMRAATEAALGMGQSVAAAGAMEHPAQLLTRGAKSNVLCGSAVCWCSYSPNHNSSRSFGAPRSGPCHRRSA